ncbi:MAG: hypothetical protein D3909_15585 [Candidatus Electrothrix sp. ATG1]|nr:hypothetical protein [Candidatus Electrothrix sp. ATG1]
MTLLGHPTNFYFLLSHPEGRDGSLYESAGRKKIFELAEQRSCVVLPAQRGENVERQDMSLGLTSY